jgi:cell division protein FtsZ
MAVGRSDGDDRARKAAEAAISSGLLDVTIDGARGILFNITGGSDLSLFEVNEAAAIIKESAHPDCNMIFGAQIDESMGDEVRITVIATGFEQSRSLKVREAQQRQQVGQPRGMAGQQGRGQGGYAQGSHAQQNANAYPPSASQPQYQPAQYAPQEPQYQQPPQPPVQHQPPAQQPPSRVYEEDDIEIPTFLRKRGK